MTEEEYRRACTVENPQFKKERDAFLVRWEPDKDLFADAIVVARKDERGKGLDAVNNQRRRQAQFMGDLLGICERWPSITPADVLAGC